MIPFISWLPRLPWRWKLSLVGWFIASGELSHGTEVLWGWDQPTVGAILLALGIGFAAML